MDWSTIVVAGLSMIGTLVGSFLAQNKTTALITYRLDQLEAKVSKHNNIVERTYKVESDVAKSFVRIDELKERINDIKREG